MKNETNEYPNDLGTAWKNETKSGDYLYSLVLKKDVKSGTKIVGFPKTIKKKDGTSVDIINFVLSNNQE